jgi:PQQ-dependent dehydrogenase (s-GDH family)
VTTAALALSCGLALAVGGGPPDSGFVRRVVTSGLEQPFEVAWGPDAHLWVTERAGRRVVRVRPADGAREVALTLPDARGNENEQDGLLGMALHPGLLKGAGTDFVYLAYTYDASADPKAPRHRLRLRRYTFDPGTRTLGAPFDLLTDLPSSPDHVAGRLVVGPDGKLYLTLGDQGANQFANSCEPNRAQWLPTAAQVEARDWSSYPGKVLRVNLDGGVPDDNPVLAGVRSHVYAYGLRNAQGLAFAPDGRLFATEHGPKTDDEVNLIEKGGNYGWPHVAGYRDDRAYVYANWSSSEGTPCASLKFSNYQVPPSVPRRKETDWNDPAFRPPLRTFFTVGSDHDFRSPASSCAADAMFFVCWPTIAPSSVEVYVARPDGIPGWTDSLLVTSLKLGALYRVPLGADGRLAPGDPEVLFHTTNRYRDLALGPDGRTIFVLTDSSGTTQSRTGGGTTVLQDRGAILELRYAPPSGSR